MFPLWKIVWQLPTKLNIILKYNVANGHVDIYPVAFKTNFHTKVCAWKFEVALFITAKTWNESRYPLRNR